MQETCKIISVDEAANGFVRVVIEEPWRMRVVAGHIANFAVINGEAAGHKTVLPLMPGPAEQQIELYSRTLSGIKPGDCMEISNEREGMGYRGKGKFLVEGAGIGLGLAFARQLRQKGELAEHYFYYQAPTLDRMVARAELRNMFGGHFVGALTEEHQPGYWSGRIGEDFLLHVPREINHEFYIAGSGEFITEAAAAAQFYGAKPEKIQALEVGRIEAPVAA